MRPNRSGTVRILGLDPGLRRTGWGVIETVGNSLSFVACGSVETSDKAALAARLAVLHEGIAAVLARYAPAEAAVEETFVNADARGALKLGQARGIALLVPAQAGLKVAEYAPNLVKKSVVGAGRAEKAQVRMMIGVLLPKANPETEDACDALAIAICHAHHRSAPALRIAAGSGR
ncbi:MAG: crossover junction endodeoxyribonuclease RuvC [Bradyrhizobiaceae bacterium]|nr:crossover junction endodeoxyribonuclease RuvC [Bradyrhizobiaceae bacterium]